VYDFKMLAEGRTVVPAAGMGALATELAQGVEVECRQSVSRLCITAGRVSGVVLADGTERYADAVVLAVPAPIAQQLSGLDIPTTPKSTVTLYWAGSQALTTQKKLWLNANPDAYVNNAMQMTAVAPEYGPVGGHLLSATVIGAPAEDDAQCYARAEHDLEELTGQPALLSTYRRLRLYRIPYAQFAQPAGIHATLPGSQTALAGLYLAGEYTIASSINAAMLSGERAARAVTRSTSGGV
jgi:phytoene dehydrogenase-like protein